jgi:hypothetical protein
MDEQFQRRYEQGLKETLQAANHDLMVMMKTYLLDEKKPLGTWMQLQSFSTRVATDDKRVRRIEFGEITARLVPVTAKNLHWFEKDKFPLMQE